MNGKVKQQTSGTATGTKCAPFYISMYMDEFEDELPVYEMTNLWYFFKYIRKKELQNFMENLNNHQPKIKFTYTFSRNCVLFLDLDIHLSEGELTTDLHIKPTDKHQYLHNMPFQPNHTNRSIVTVKHLQ